MKDNSIAPTVSRVGSFSESKFGIASSEDLVYIFDILRNKLYSDKAMAVVREYSTNAADANVENGLENKPVEITVPNRMNPVFKVRDFGKGLTEDEIRSVYCMYGRSTKRNSNAFTGQLGLGSKSGFAYGDSFAITSFFNGIKTVYSAYIDETKLGSVAKIQSEPTNEANGIEISIPVKSSDVDVFRDKISSVVKHFKVKPIINGSIDVQESSSVFSGRFWSVDNPKTSNWGHGGSFKNATAVMGNIGYPIDVSLVFPEIKNYWGDKNPDAYRFLTGSVIINFDIGELSIAASREELEYNAMTVSAIKNKATKAFKELMDSIHLEISKASDGLLARILLSKVKTFTSVGAWGDIENRIVWNGKKLNGSLIPCGGRLGIEVDSYAYSTTTDKVIRTTNLNTITVSKELISSNLMWCVENPEDSRLSGTKMSQMARKNPGKVFYLFKITKGDVPNVSKYDGNSWFDEISFPKSYLKNLATYEIERSAVKRKVVNRRAKGQIEVYKLNEKTKTWGVQAENWTPLITDASAVSIYVPISKFKIIVRGVERNIDVIDNIRAACKEFGIDMPNFYGVKSADVEKLSNASSLSDHLSIKIENSKDFKDSIFKVYNKHIVSDSKLWSISPILSSGIINVSVDDKIDTESPFYKMMNLIEQCQHNLSYEKVQRATSLADFCGVDREKITSETSRRLELLVKEVHERYPLLKYLSNVCRGEYESSLKAVYQYINKIDENS